MDMDMHVCSRATLIDPFRLINLCPLSSTHVLTVVESLFLSTSRPAFSIDTFESFICCLFLDTHWRHVQSAIHTHTD